MTAHEPRLSGTKVCSKCERKLPAIAFPVKKSNADGLDSRCRECQCARHRVEYRSHRKRPCWEMFGDDIQ